MRAQSQILKELSGFRLKQIHFYDDSGDFVKTKYEVLDEKDSLVALSSSLSEAHRNLDEAISYKDQSCTTDS